MINYKNNNNPENAFILLLQEYKKGNGKDDKLENLYLNVRKYIATALKNEIGEEYDLTEEEFSSLIFGTHQNINLNKIFNDNILRIAYDTIGKDGKRTLGNYAPIGKDGKIGFNSSSWICHVLQVAEFASDLACSMGLDPNTAKKLGILHDIGRTVDHSFAHTEKGFEILKSLGWNNEATICLTHSYLGGNIAANNELAPDGWGIDENGKQFWENGKKTPMAKWLDTYQNNEYDLVIQLADLLVEQREIVNIQDRIEGIKSRRESKGIKLDDQPNRAYFLTTLYNIITDIICKINPDNREEVTKKFPHLDKISTVEEIENLLYNGENSLSAYFSNFYQHNIKVKTITPSCAVQNALEEGTTTKMAENAIKQEANPKEIKILENAGEIKND